MLTPKILNDIKNRLVKAYDPLEIYLFGSHAWGQSDEESDVDLLIIVESSDEKRHLRCLTGYDALSELRIPNEIIVYTKQEFAERVANVSTLAHKIKMRGKLVYAKA